MRYTYFPKQELKFTHPKKNNCTAAVRSAVTVGSLPQRDLAALANAAVAAAVWHGHQLVPMKLSAELDYSDLLTLIRQPEVR